GVYVSGDYAYVADRSSGLQIIDISNPSSPTLKGSYNTPGYALGVYVSGSYAYVADSYDGLQIIDISNPSSPTLKGSYDTPGYALGVYVSGSYAYVADDSSGLQIIDISNPSSPTLAGSYDTPGWAYGVYVSGSYAYVADDYYGLQIIDISNPSSPTLKGSYDTPGYAVGVYVSGSYAYVTDGTSGLQIIDISNPSSPTLAGSYDTPGIARGVYVSGSYAYVAEESALYILEFNSDNTFPSAFNLISPIGNITDDTPTYLWNKSYDDYFSNYKLYVNDTLKATITDTTWTQPAGLTDGQYVWYVIASDSAGNTTQSTQRDTFYLDAVLPTPPVLLSPANGTNETVLNALIWRKSTDAYPGISGYKVQIDEDSLFGSPDSVLTADTSYTPVLTEGRYYWRVKAINLFSHESEWSAMWSFVYDTNPTGIAEKYLDEKRVIPDRTEVIVTMTEVRYTNTAMENIFAVYDITGNVMHSEVNIRTGKHSYSTEHLSSGIYFIRFRDGERQINRKMVIIR
ncbi:MAG: T9SS type A sorting domain-containing protein, partial [bacterium]